MSSLEEWNVRLALMALLSPPRRPSPWRSGRDGLISQRRARRGAERCGLAPRSLAYIVDPLGVLLLQRREHLGRVATERREGSGERCCELSPLRAEQRAARRRQQQQKQKRAPPAVDPRGESVSARFLAEGLIR